MKRMFKGATKFNKSLNKWDVSKVKNMKGMFNGATKFNKNINKWKVNNNKLKNMFKKCGISNGKYGFSTPTPKPKQFNQ
jgi:hypothetical protein